MGGDICGQRRRYLRARTEISGQRRRYLRARTEISAGKDGDISGQGRGYPPQCRVTGRQDKAYIDLNSANRYRLGRVKAIIHVLLYVLGKSVVWRFRNVDGLLRVSLWSNNGSEWTVFARFLCVNFARNFKERKKNVPDLSNFIVKLRKAKVS